MFISTPPTRFYIATAQSVLHLGVESFTFFSRRRWILRNIFTCTSSAPTRFFTSRQRKVYCILCFSFILFANFQMETSWVHFKCTNVYLMAPTRSPFFCFASRQRQACHFSFILVSSCLPKARPRRRGLHATAHSAIFSCSTWFQQQPQLCHRGVVLAAPQRRHVRPRKRKRIT